MTRRHGGPPWWPEGEHWPSHGDRPGPPGPPGPLGYRGPHGPPWHSGRAARRFRRRFFSFATLVLVTLVGIGFLLGRAGDERTGPPSERDERSPFGLVFVLGAVAVIGSVATARAYRKLSRPIGGLLEAAEQVAEGDYAVAVRPTGPRELRRFTATFNDMAERLAATDEQRRRFLADVTHELRTPLAVLQSGIEAQIDGIHPRDDEHLESLLEETDRLGRLIADLHTLALAEAGRLVLHREPVRLDTLVEDAVAAHLTLAEAKGVSLGSSIVEGLPELNADPVRLRQVLDNLLANAVRHTPAGREVGLDVRSDDEGVEVTVSDAGPGFPLERLASVFDRFGRPSDTGGSGLGLSIVRDLVEAHGGTVSARNRPGGGAVVAFSLPL